MLDEAEAGKADPQDAEQRRFGRRGENEALKDAVAFLREVQDTEVEYIPAQQPELWPTCELLEIRIGVSIANAKL